MKLYTRGYFDGRNTTTTMRRFKSHDSQEPSYTRIRPPFWFDFPLAKFKLQTLPDGVIRSFVQWPK